MKRNVLFLVCVLLLGTGVYSSVFAAKVKGNGTLVTKEVPVGDYASIKIGAGIECNNKLFSKSSYKNPAFSYEQGKGNASLSITIDENLFPLLDIKTSGKDLIVGVKRGTSINPSQMTVKGSSGELQEVSVSGCVDFFIEDAFTARQMEINISGASDVKIKGRANIDQLKISISGAGDFSAGNLTCKEIESRVSGAGDIDLAGKADVGKFSVTGAGDIKAFDFEVKHLECRVSGAGDIKVTATETLNASVSGTGDIHYKGNAEANTKISGFGDIKRIKN